MVIRGNMLANYSAICSFSGLITKKGVKLNQQVENMYLVVVILIDSKKKH